MKVKLTKHDGYTLAETEGPLDDDAREAFREHLHPIVGERGGKLLIDLSQSTRVNSQGLGHLVTLVVHANTNSSRVVLCSPPPFVDMVFTVSKLNTFFNVAPTRDEAATRLA